MHTLLTQRGSLPYQTDGAVIKLDSTAQQMKIGTGSKSPKWAIAFKYGEEEAEAELIRWGSGVEWSGWRVEDCL